HHGRGDDVEDLQLVLGRLRLAEARGQDRQQRRRGGEAEQARVLLVFVPTHSAGASSSSGWPQRSRNAASTAAPTRYRRSSAIAGAMIWRPTGRLSSGARPQGTDMA